MSKVFFSGISSKLFKFAAAVSCALIFVVPFGIWAEVKTYTITGSETSFTVTDGASSFNAATVQGIVDALRPVTNGSDCIFQFGNGENTLNIGEANITFDGGENGTAWGKITLTGSITSMNNLFTIALLNGASIESEAHIANTSNSGIALINGSTGTVTISSGMVSSNGEYGGAIRNSGFGTVDIIGGIVSSVNGYNVIENSSHGIVSISGGMVSAPGNLTAVFNSGFGKVTISGAAEITSANAVSNGSNTVRNSSSGTIEILGGTVSNTSSSGNAVGNSGSGKVTISGTAEITSSASFFGTVYNFGIGVIEIIGGTISNTSSTDLAVNDYNGTGTILFGNAPQINGLIGGTVSLITDGANSFAPGSKTYTLNSASYAYGAIAVVDGVPYADKFTINNASFELYEHEGDLRMVTTGVAICIISFDLNGGNGMPPKPIFVPAGSRLHGVQKPTANSFTKTDAVNDGKWYTRSGETYTEFVFNSNAAGTVVDANVTLYLKWIEPNVYSITSSGTGFIPYFGSIPISFGGGAVPIQDAVDNIKNHAIGAGCHIRFGNGTDALNIGTENITFDGGTNKDDWGNITLLGSITSSYVTTESWWNNNGAIVLANGVYIESKANIVNTAASGRAIYNNSNSTIIISESTVSAAGSSGTAIYSNSNGTVIVNGGTVSATGSSGTAIYNGTVTVSDGAVSAIGNEGTAIFINIDGTVNISGGTITAAAGTAIHNSSNSNNYGGTVIISGGAVSVTGSLEGRSLSTILNSGILTISGGTVSATSGIAVVNQHFNNNVATATISGGTVSATSGEAISNSDFCKVTISGTAKITSATTSSAGMISNNGFGIIEILGGMILNTSSNGIAVNAFSATASIVLGGTPQITGLISGFGSEKVSVITFGENVFAPAGNVYTFFRGYSNTTTYSNGMIAVSGGANFLDNFTLYNTPCYAFRTENNNIVLNDQAYIVTFKNHDGAVLQTGPVACGSNATAPSNLFRAGHTFDGWDVTFTNVTSDLTVTAKWTINTYTVTWPTASAITYGAALSTSTLNGGSATGGDGANVAGIFTWTPSGEPIIPTVTNSGYSVTFTPSDNNYAAVTKNDIAITVNKANPTVTWPTSTAITYGAALSTSTLNGGSAIGVGSANVAGTFTWTPSGEPIIPTVTNSGYSAVFTPSDNNYAAVTKSDVTITVNKANPTITWPSNLNAKVGETLADVSIIGGTGTGTFTWTTPAASVGAAGSQTHSMTFTPTDIANYSTLTQNVTIAVDAVSILSPNRNHPNPQPNKESIEFSPFTLFASEFIAGPNPVAKQSGIVKFFWQGKRIQSASLNIYDAFGNVINKKIAIKDNVVGTQERRPVGSWNLTDNKGRQVSEGTYLVRGTITAADGKKERISVIIGVR